MSRKIISGLLSQYFPIVGKFSAEAQKTFQGPLLAENESDLWTQLDGSKAKVTRCQGFLKWEATVNSQ